jgi:pimeloyl-ACP methyl ester carboxylesterase
MARRWRDHGFSVLGLNYRGVSTSLGESTRHGLVLDVVAALSFLTASPLNGGEGLPPHSVALLGHSLGGGVAPEAAAFFPGVAVISDRSFSRLSDAAGGLFLLSAPPAARAALRFVIARLAAWEFDATRHWRALPPASAKLAVVEPGDEVIKVPAQLASELAGRGFVPSGEPASPDAAGSAMVMEQLRGSAHNRAWTDAEMARVLRWLNAAMTAPQVGSAGGVWRPGVPQRV